MTTKKINKPELAILNDVFVTVASQILNSLINDLRHQSLDTHNNDVVYYCWRLTSSRVIFIELCRRVSVKFPKS